MGLPRLRVQACLPQPESVPIVRVPEGIAREDVGTERYYRRRSLSARTPVFQFEDVVGVVEWLGDSGEAHRLDAGKHYPST